MCSGPMVSESLEKDYSAKKSPEDKNSKRRVRDTRSKGGMLSDGGLKLYEGIHTFFFLSPGLADGSAWFKLSF